MIKKLLSVSLLLAGFVSFSQQAKLDLNNESFSGPVKNTSAYKIGKPVGTPQAGPCMDTVFYLYWKNTLLGSPTSFVTTSIPAQTGLEGAFTYLNNGTVLINGLGCLTSRRAGSPSSSIPVRIVLYNVNASNIPTTAIDSVTVNVTGTSGNFFYGGFGMPKVVSGNFAVAYKNMSTNPNDTIRLWMTRAQTAAAASNKFGEGLGYIKVAGNWATTNSLFTTPATNDFEPVAFPIASYSFTPNFTTAPNTPCVNNAVTFTNTTNNINVVKSRFFNWNIFNKYWATTGQQYDSVWAYIYGDGGFGFNENESHIYTAAATYNDSLYGSIWGFSASYCLQVIGKTITINACTSIDEYNKDQFSVHPNPSTGVFHLSNLPLNATIRVVNILGETVKRFESTSVEQSVDLSNLNPGAYYFMVSGKDLDKVKTVKVVLNN